MWRLPWDKRLLISENRCTPCRGKPDQHATCIPRSVRIWFQTIRILRGQCIAAIREPLMRKKGSRHNLQHAGWLICGSIPSFSPEPTNEVVGLSQAYVNNKLLGLLSPYHRHAIGTFNTSSRGPTDRSLTDTGKGYSLSGTDFPHTTPRPCQPTVSTFHQRAVPHLQFNHSLPNIPRFKF
jgi:hypothetical protein